MPDVYQRIGGLFAILASADDKQVGRALEQIDAALAEAGITWAQLGARVSSLGGSASSTAPDPRRAVNGAARPPSQWRIDRDDVVKLYEHCCENGAPDSFTEQFSASLHDWMVGQGRGISARQREVLHEKLDQLGL